MSSMRNAVSRRPHKERAQLKSREKWGILEKHKDYSLRAKDFNLKKKKLSQLAEKARDRNPDEFAFGMLSAGAGKHGKHGARGNENLLSHDAVKLLKTQDAGYLKTSAAKGRKEIERLQQEVGMDLVMSHAGAGEKTVFDDQHAPGGKEQPVSGDLANKRTNLDTALLASTQSEGLVSDDEPPVPQTMPLSKAAQATQKDSITRLRAERKRRTRLQELRLARLEALKTRQREILAVADQLELQRAKMAGVVGGINKHGIKFKTRERKR